MVLSDQLSDLFEKYFSYFFMRFKNSFKYAAAVLWNDLPDDFRKILISLRIF